MIPFEEELEKEIKDKMPKIDEGNESTDEQKKLMMELQQDFQNRKLSKFEQLMKESKAEIFNTNVFKKV